MNQETRIKDIVIDNDQKWSEEHLKTLHFNYKKSKNFSKIYPLIEKIYAKKYEKLIDLNMDIIKLFLKLLKIKTKIIDDEDLKPKGQKNELLIDLVKKIKGDIYLSGQGAKNYMDLAKFNKAGIEITWQNFEHPKYQQLWGEFIPNLSALDYLFCESGKVGLHQMPGCVMK